MKKVELLIPAGSFECLEAAIYNGADAVYLAGSSFGARKYAKNFTEDEIIEAVKLAHLYDVKVYVTVNTIVYEEEVNDFIKYIEFLYVSGVDALIMQDLGMVSLVHKYFPDFEIHASTQMHTVTDSALKYLEELGVKRVVFGRELSLNEIENIETPLEKEIFIHGALCVSYSGQCLFSSLVGGRSGNRGECAGSCRLPYNLYKNDEKIHTDGKYLLSMKELSSLDNLEKILQSNVDSLKIEGRMKGFVYVSFITRLYRKLIDKFYNNEKLEITEQDRKNLSVIFNREFTKGFLFNETSKNITNIISPNHKGIPIGKVVSVKDKIKIELTEDLNQNDGIRFGNEEGLIVNFLYDKNMLLTKNVKKGNICYIDNKVNAYVNDIVYKTIDSKLSEEIINYEKKKMPVKLKVKAIDNELLEVSYNDVKLTGTIVQRAIKRPTMKEEIIRSLSKLGNTPFYVSEYEDNIGDNIFVSVNELNDLRRKCIMILIENKTMVKREYKPLNIKFKLNEVKRTNDLSFLVRNEIQLKHLLTKNVNSIYVTDRSLYEKYKDNKNVFFRVPRAMYKLPDFNNENILVSELGSIYKYRSNNNIVIDAYSNVVNTYSLYELFRNNAKKITLSYELNTDQIYMIMNSFNRKYGFYPNVEVVIYGKPELMITKYCLLNKVIGSENGCSICKHNDKYYLEDRMNEKYRILNDNCLTYIMHYKNIDLFDKVNELKKMNVTNFRIDLLDEDEKDIDNLISRIKNIN